MELFYTKYNKKFDKLECNAFNAYTCNTNVG